MPAPRPDMMIVYVADPLASAAFYERLLETPPLETSPGFAMFALSGGLMLGLWRRDAVQPAATPPQPLRTADAELAFQCDAATLDSLCMQWRERGAVIAQEPVDMDFGRTFVALDPDGHRLRAFTPSQR